MTGAYTRAERNQRLRAVGDEISIVGYDPVMQDSIADHYASDESWVLVATFRDLPQAHVARGTLEAAGLTVALTDEYTVGADWLMSIAIGGVGLGVKESQEEAAREILERESFDVDLAPELGDDLPEELRPDLSEEQAAREEEYVEVETLWKRFVAGTGIVLLVAPIFLPVLVADWLWARYRSPKSGEP